MQTISTIENLLDDPFALDVLTIVVAQEDPTATPEVTPEVPVWRYETIGEQDVRWDYVISAGDVMISGLLVVLVVSVWVFAVLFVIGGRRRE